jgi:hypothetical protein
VRNARAAAQSKDWDGITELLGQPEFDQIEDNLLKLVNGPILNTDDKKTIGTRKRYGIAADVIYGVGGVKGAIENLDNPQIESCKSGTCSGNFVDVEVEVPKSLNSLKASLSEILQICKSYKVMVRSCLRHAKASCSRRLLPPMRMFPTPTWGYHRRNPSWSSCLSSASAQRD